MKSTERAAQWSLILIAVVLVFAALDAAEEIFAPIVLALVAGIVLSPVTETLDRLGLPHAMAALSSFFTGLVLIVAIAMMVQPIVYRTVETIPTVWKEVNSAMYTVKGEIRSVREMSDNLRSILDTSGDPVENDAETPGSEGASQDAPSPPDEGSALPTVEDVLFMAPTIAAQILIFIGSLFFFILTRKAIYIALASRLAGPGQKDEVALRLRHAERQVSRYFLTISVINVGLGLCVGTGMAVIGMPSPVIWGALAFLLNYFLYVGPAGFAGVLIIAGITVFDGIQVLLPLAIYLGMNMIEAQFVTPALIGRRLSVNPLMVFLSLVFFMWLWGPMGAIVAIPLLVWAVVLTADIRDIRRAEAERHQAGAEAEPA